MALSSLPVEQKVLACCALYVAVRLASGEDFEKNAIFAVTGFVAYVCHSSLRLAPTNVLEVAVCAGAVLTLLTLLLRSAADVVVLACLAGALTKPAEQSLDGEALRRAFLTARDAKAEAAPSLWDRVVQRAQATFDDIVASVASRAADVAFRDLHVARLARVGLPTQRVLLLGAFSHWINLSAHVPGLALRLDAALFRENNWPSAYQTVLVRVPQDAKPNQRLSIVAPDGSVVDFVLPPSATPGALLVVTLPRR
mmetsp:Transcript_27537/g.84468  ORF Transcript_27537/g.84468 Transcript_27537/m.84468 type:complete len:254 (-) Transcript_27537:212-973(-)|eukprot:CAMPEP_0198666930 /NCGR_PEP_ID=MMETSP1467-20131203/66669_1 /TAXON_ID=1462469 /ORGANISM="unid. sp., Strain CCMP2135" /LENGTH=253 /DNA_ID=CAMNT_0044403601 /DNA_START=125 /DNA_END=886 /DNA_ORIENTATION=+